MSLERNHKYVYVLCECMIVRWIYFYFIPTYYTVIISQSLTYVIQSHESDAFGSYFEKVYFLNFQNMQRLILRILKRRTCTQPKANTFLAFVNLIFFNLYFLKM